MAIKVISNSTEHAGFSGDYIGLSTDVKPTVAAHPDLPAPGIGSRFYEYNTGLWYITYDGTNWVAAGEAATGIKVVETELLAWQLVAAGAQAKSSAFSLTGKKKLSVSIEIGRTVATAMVGTGPEIRVLASMKDSGDDAWFPLVSYVGDIGGAATIATDATEAIGQTRIETGATLPAVGDYVFFYNSSDVPSSEMSKVIKIDATGGSEYFDILHALTYAHASGNYFNKGEKAVFVIDVEAIKRIEVICNNNNGSTNQAICTRVSCTSVS
jgi:hypothetical protein